MSFSFTTYSYHQRATHTNTPGIIIYTFNYYRTALIRRLPKYENINTYALLGTFRKYYREFIYFSLMISCGEVVYESQNEHFY